MDTNKTASKTFNIENGPSKDTLFDACKYAYSEHSNIKVNFSIAAGYTMPLDHPNCAYLPMELPYFIIQGIQHEDGSGESFNLQGFCKAKLYNSLEENVGFKPYRFEAYYNSKNRKGTIELFEN